MKRNEPHTNRIRSFLGWKHPFYAVWRIPIPAHIERHIYHIYTPLILFLDVGNPLVWAKWGAFAEVRIPSRCRNSLLNNLCASNKKNKSSANRRIYLINRFYVFHFIEWYSWDILEFYIVFHWVPNCMANDSSTKKTRFQNIHWWIHLETFCYILNAKKCTNKQKRELGTWDTIVWPPNIKDPRNCTAIRDFSSKIVHFWVTFPTFCPFVRISNRRPTNAWAPKLSSQWHVAVGFASTFEKLGNTWV
jgi:hypothetical protein